MHRWQARANGHAIGHCGPQRWEACRWLLGRRLRQMRLLRRLRRRRGRQRWCTIGHRGPRGRGLMRRRLSHRRLQRRGLWWSHDGSARQKRRRGRRQMWLRHGGLGLRRRRRRLRHGGLGRRWHGLLGGDGRLLRRGWARRCLGPDDSRATAAQRLLRRRWLFWSRRATLRLN